MNTWVSVEAVIEEFQLSAKPEDLDSVLAELRQEMRNIHPNKSRGEFPDRETKERYHRVEDACRFVEKEKARSYALISVDKLPAIIESVSKAIVKTQQPGIEDLASTFRVEYRDSIRRKYFMPKVASGVLAAVSSSLFMFAGQFENHPVLKRFFEPGYPVRDPELPSRIGELFGMITLQLALLAGVGFLLLWFIERRREAKADYLLSDDGLHDVFSKLVNSEVIHRESNNKYVFSKRQLSSLIKEGIAGIHLTDDTLVDKVASIDIRKLQELNVVQKKEAPDIEEVYEVSAEIVERYRSGCAAGDAF